MAFSTPSRQGLSVCLTNVTTVEQEIAKLREMNETRRAAPPGRFRNPRGLKTKLQVHQKDALKWMLSRETGEPKGGILADDMGLGKTLSMIALIMKTEQGQAKPSRRTTATDDSDSSESEDDQENLDEPKGGTLVICPLTLMSHWENEITDHVRDKKLCVVKHQGPTRSSETRTLAQLSHVVITTYDVVRQEAEKGPLFKMSWKRIILDEAHEVRNPDSLRCKAVCSLKADYRWCVTGTPIHNSLIDLYSLFKFLKWSPFDDLEVWEGWIGKESLIHSSLWKELSLAGLLRRTKKEIRLSEESSLPQKEENYIYIDLDISEDDLYQRVALYSEQIRETEVMPVPRNGPYSKETLKYMYTVLMLRQICNHPSLLKEEDGNINMDLDVDPSIVSPEDPTDNENVNESEIIELKACWNGTKAGLEKYCNFKDPVFDSTRRSSKIEKLLMLLTEILKKKDKVVIVSQWTKMLDIISKFLTSSSISHKTLSGKVLGKDRPGIVKDFNDLSSPLKVLLLSLKAGGVGLNLIGGNHLILFDLHWNPQLETQACDRIYRMGQKKPVFIHKFIIRDSIEEKIRDRQMKKLELADSVLENPSAQSIRSIASLADNESDFKELVRPRRKTPKRKATE